jgi:hypothetical protein
MQANGSLAAAVALLAALGAPALTQSDLPGDVPQSHWAAESVRVVLRAGVLTAPGDRFAGARRVTRAELIAVLVRVVRKLEARSWPTTEPSPLPARASAQQWQKRPVTRYDLAAVLARVVPYAVAGLPARSASRPVYSEAIPDAPNLSKVRASAAVKRELKYLADRRMVWPRSPLLEPERKTVTGRQLADALSQVIAGLNGRMTEEPKDEPELTRPPR